MRIVDSEAQLVTAAISAFQANNRALSQLGRAPRTEAVIPGIVMVRARPMFYAIPVSEALSRAVATGMSPAAETQAERCIVPWWHTATGMEVPAFRVKALRYFHGFKAFVEILWSQYY